jgi:hypothetical protein
MNKESTLHEWMEDPVGKKVLEPLFAPMVEQMQMTLVEGMRMNKRMEWRP